MRISVFFDHVREASAQTGRELEDVLREVRSFGITALECSLESLLEDVPGRKVLFEKCDMQVSCIYATYDFANETDPARAYPLIDIACDFGADKVLIVPGFVEIKDISEQDAVMRVGTDQMEQMARVLNELCRYAEEKNVTVTMEDYDDAHAPFASHIQLAWFLERVQGLKISFDTGNFLYAGVDVLEAFELLRLYICHVHCKDRSLNPCPLETPKLTVTGQRLYAASVGEGCIPMEEIIRRLKSEGYDGTVAIEHFGATDQLAYMERSAKWLLERI